MTDDSAKQNTEGSSAGSTSFSLIERLKQNETPAWRELVQLYSPLIFYWCQKQGLPNQDCADIVQDVFRSIVTNIDKFRKERPSDTFRGWLRTITRNKVTDYYRAAGRGPVAAGGTEAMQRLTNAEDLDDEVEGDDEEARVELELFSRATDMIRKDFRTPTWQAFWLIVVEGRSAQEAADQLEMTAGAVRVAKSRVLKRLREQLGDLI